MLESDSETVASMRPGSLLTAATPLIGRATELASVRDMLGANRLVTLTGPGGVGKTRLAIAVAENEVDGGGTAHVVDLGTVGTGEQVCAKVAASLGLPLIVGDPLQQLVDTIASRPWLVVLDNCEHVRDRVAEMVDALLRVPGAVRLLATSREQLRIPTEQVFPVPPLSVSGDDPPARALFLARARTVRPNIGVDDHDASVIDQLCRRLDGLPLAIELAAARTATLTLADLLARIDDPLRLLRGGRGRSDDGGALEAALAWSYDLLDPEEQWFFRRLGVFVAGFDVEAVAAVTGLDEFDVLDLLDALASKSLVTDTGSGRRYRLLETVRAFARQRLVTCGEDLATGDAHANHYRSLVAVNGQWRMPDCAASAALVDDWGNISAAFDWYAGRCMWRASAEVLGGTTSLVIDHGFARDALPMLDRCLAHADTIDASTLERVRLVGFIAAIPTNDWFRHETMLDELEHATDPTIRAVASAERALVNFVLHPGAASAHIDRALSIVAEHGAGPEAAVLAYSWRSIADMLDGDLDAALVALGQAQLHDQEVGHPTTFRAFARDLLAICFILKGEPDNANTILAGPPVPTVWDRSRLLRAVALADIGDIDGAARSILEWAASMTGGRVASESNDALLALAAIASAGGDAKHALRLLTAAGVPRHIILFPLGVGLGRRIEADGIVRRHYQTMAASNPTLSTADEVVSTELARLRTLVAPIAASPPPGLAGFLTARERQVLSLIGQGLANKQIARRLGISEKTVRNHLSSVFVKLGVSDRTQAALHAVAHGLTTDTSAP